MTLQEKLISELDGLLEVAYSDCQCSDLVRPCEYCERRGHIMTTTFRQCRCLAIVHPNTRPCPDHSFICCGGREGHHQPSCEHYPESPAFKAGRRVAEHVERVILGLDTNYRYGGGSVVEEDGADCPTIVE